MLNITKEEIVSIITDPSLHVNGDLLLTAIAVAVLNRANMYSVDLTCKDDARFSVRLGRFKMDLATNYPSHRNEYPNLTRVVIEAEDAAGWLNVWGRSPDRSIPVIDVEKFTAVESHIGGTGIVSAGTSQREEQPKLRHLYTVAESARLTIVTTLVELEELFTEVVKDLYDSKLQRSNHYHGGETAYLESTNPPAYGIPSYGGKPVVVIASLKPFFDGNSVVDTIVKDLLVGGGDAYAIHSSRLKSRSELLDTPDPVPEMRREPRKHSDIMASALDYVAQFEKDHRL